jgi:rhodanese-related sulfurtransferase
VSKFVFAFISSLVLVSGAAAFLIRRHAPESPKPALAPAVAAPRAINAADLKKKKDAGRDLFLAFVGNPSYFSERRIPGAVCVPYADIARTFASVDRSREIVLYCGCCSGNSEGLSGAAVRDLQKLGFTNVSHLDGHYAAWQSAGFPSEGTNPIAVKDAAYANDEQKLRLQEFTKEAARRRHEVAGLVDAERDPEKKQHLATVLVEVERNIEIDGLQLKRAMALENGDTAKAAGIEAMLAKRGVPVRR